MQVSKISFLGIGPFGVRGESIISSKESALTQRRFGVIGENCGLGSKFSYVEFVYKR